MGTDRPRRPRSRLRERREELHLSVAQVAHEAGVHRSTPPRWESGESDPYHREHPGIAKAYKWPLDRLDELLARDGEQHALRVIDDDEATERSAMLAAATSGGRIGVRVVRAVSSLTGELRRLDDQAGGGAVLPLAESHMDLVSRLLTHGSYMPGVGEKLRHAFADAAELAGWVAYDAGEHARSARHYALSLNAAHQSGDPLMVTYTLAMMGFGTRYTPDAAAEQLLDAAWSSIPQGARNDGVRAAVRAWQFHAAAARGDTRPALKALSESATLFERSNREDWPEWAYWLWHPERMADTGHALNMLGDHRRAIEVLTAGEEMAAAWPRDRVLYIAYLAEAHRGRHDLEAARHHRDRAIALMGDEIISGRLATLLGVAPTT